MKTFLLNLLVLTVSLGIWATTSQAQNISAGSFHSIALCTTDSTVRAWGGNENGQLGVNDTVQRNSAVLVHGPGNVGFLKGIVAVVVRENFSLALKSDGTVWAWGYNADGECGDNTKIDKWAPVQVHGPGNVGFLTGIVAISGGYNHVLALRNDSTVWAWGDNSTGELGDSTTVTNDSTPVQVHGPGNVGFLTGVVSIAAGQQFSLVLKKDGTVWSWGFNAVGSLGDNTSVNRYTPVQVHGANNVGYLTNVISLAAGGGHALAIRNDSTLWSWGFNINGELGDNTTNTDSVPEQVHGPGNSGFLTGVVYAKAGDYFSGAIKNDGSVWTWGYNYYGQCGVNDTTGEEVNTPVQVHGPGNAGYLSGITAISLGDEHALALKNDGSLWAWGWNGNGQLGNDSTVDRWYPISIPEPCSVPLAVPTVIDENNITVYPNPASNQLIVINDKRDINIIELYNMLGVKIYKSQIPPNTPAINIDVSSQTAGAYLLRLTTGSAFYNKIIVIKR
jgi:alpha-tubulin suppressor-like RCC1 family protein